MRPFLSALALLLALGPAPLSAQGIDFGDDTSLYANDGECDDPRFEGPGMTTTPLLDSDRMHDATDCRTAYEAGEIRLRDGASGEPGRGGDGQRRGGTRLD